LEQQTICPAALPHRVSPVTDRLQTHPEPQLTWLTSVQASAPVGHVPWPVTQVPAAQMLPAPHWSSAPAQHGAQVPLQQC
jgi:hypothetical protein